MHCSNCGTQTCGKYCCNCGRKIENHLERFHREERRVRRDFLTRCKKCAPFDSLNAARLAEAAWFASALRISHGLTIYSTERDVAPAFSRLHDCADRAARLYAFFLRDAAECGVQI